MRLYGSLVSVLLLTIPSLQAQNGRVYFSNVQPEIIQDVYVTPDEKTLVVKSGQDIVATDVNTGARLMWWKLPVQKGYANSLDFQYSKAELIPAPSNFTKTYGPHTMLLHRPWGRNEPLGTFNNIRYYTPRKVWSSSGGEVDNLVGYDPDGRMLRLNNDNVTVGSGDQREVLIQNVTQPQIIGYNRFIKFWRPTGKSKPYSYYYLYDLVKAQLYRLDDPTFVKAIRDHDVRLSKCYPEYLLIRGKFIKKNKRTESFYYDFARGRILDLPVNEGKCEAAAANSYASPNFFWKTVRRSVTDSTGTYDATLVEAYHRKTGALTHRVQLTHNLSEKKRWEDGTEQRVTAASERREERRAHAIAAARGETEYTAFGTVQRAGRYRSDGAANLRYDLSQDRTVEGSLLNYLAPGDDIYFPNTTATLTISAVDRENNLLVFGEPGTTVASHDRVHYLPLLADLKVCHLETVYETVTTTASCPKCSGRGEIFAGTREKPGGSKGQWYFSGFNSSGEATYSRTIEQERVYNKCSRCRGGKSVPSQGSEARGSYVCLQAKR